MKTQTKHLYSLSNASLTLRVIEHLRDYYQAELTSVAVINTIDCWLVKINLVDSVDLESIKNLQAFLNEMGVPYHPSPIISTALSQLEMGESPVKIMNRYRVAIVAYGRPEKKEIEIFREQIVERLGYCPQNLA